MRTTIASASALMALLLAGCGGGGGAPRPAGTIEMLVSFGGSPSPTRSIGEVDSIAVTVTASGIDPVIRHLKLDPDTHSASDTFAVIAGSARRFSVVALDKSATALYSGETTTDIQANVTTQIDVVLSPVDGAVDITVIIHQGPPGIDFTYVPPIGNSNNLKGIITGGTNPNKLAVAVYIKVFGGWWTKPYWDTSLTIPKSDGTWECAIVTGGYDDQATDIVAYLVRRDATVPILAGGGHPDIPDSQASKEVHRE